MTTDAPLHESLATIFGELVDGPPGDFAFVLNPGDDGLLRSLDRLAADAASARPTGGASIAAHVRHVTYGLSLLNRWAAGEDPYPDADWAAAWQANSVSDAEWERLRAGLRDEARRWRQTIATPRAMSATERNGVVASVVHLAYHLGAMRQIDRTLRGPPATRHA
jgi:hypothetical protein